MKEYILKLIENDIGAARDNVIRAEFSFRGQDLSKTYGSSGETKQSILDGYRSWLAEGEKAKAWLLQHD